jgi:hypothetical protein
VAGLTGNFKTPASVGDIKVCVHPESTKAQTRIPQHNIGAMTSTLPPDGMAAKSGKVAGASGGAVV